MASCIFFEYCSNALKKYYLKTRLPFLKPKTINTAVDQKYPFHKVSKWSPISSFTGRMARCHQIIPIGQDQTQSALAEWQQITCWDFDELEKIEISQQITSTNWEKRENQDPGLEKSLFWGCLRFWKLNWKMFLFPGPPTALQVTPCSVASSCERRKASAWGTRTEFVDRT